MRDIFDLLSSAQLLSATSELVVRAYAEKWKVSGFHALLDTNIFDEEELADHLARLLKMDRVYTLHQHAAGERARRFISYRQALEWECFPSMISEEGWLEIIMADPTQRRQVEHFRQTLVCDFRLAVATRSDILKAIDDYYSLYDQLPFLQVKD